MSNDYVKHFSMADGIYLLSHSVGRMPRKTQQLACDNFFGAWQQSKAEPWTSWLDSIQRFRAALALLFNAQAEEFCPQTNLTSGLAKIISGLVCTPTKRVILASENDFPSIGFLLKQSERLGFEIRWLPKNSPLLDLNTWDQALAEEVCAVFISHVHYNTNTQVPVAGICEMAKQRDIFSIVDIAQSGGILPIDFSQWPADVVLGSCVKWLCGGPGAGFLWAGSERSKTLNPTDVGWFSHRDPFEFDIRNFEYADSANRYWGGTPSVLPYEVARHSIELIIAIGVSTIYQHNRALQDILLTAIEPQALVTPQNAACRGGTLVLDPQHRAAVENKLRHHKVQFDARASGIRLSPHIYNSESDMSLVAECFRSA